MFLHYLLNENEQSLLYKFLMAQDRNPTRNDWTITVRKDLQFLNLGENFEEIKQMSRYSLKLMVKKEIKMKAFQELLDIQKEGSKIKGHYDELKMQEYLINQELSTDEKRTVFKMRCRTIEVKRNYRNKHTDNMLCPLCGQHEDFEWELLRCGKILEQLPDLAKVDLHYDDVYGQETEKIVKIGKIFHTVMEVRNQLLEE